MAALEFALLGGTPAFNTPLPVGQLYFPSWDRYKAAMRGIFDRHYYTNQGPLVTELEEKLQDYLRVKHVICVTNATIGLMMAVDALGLKGKVILPAFTFVASAQSLQWAGIEPVFCDVTPDTHQIDLGEIEALIDHDVSGIMGVNLWGGSCDPNGLAALAAAHNLRLYFDSAHAFGCAIGKTMIGNFGSLEVFSFHATKIMSATEGGCICTNSDDVAAHLRNIRSSYGAGKLVKVVKTANGRMSEAQAAIGLMSLEDFPANQENNKSLYKVYEERLANIDGIHIIAPAGVSSSNYQYLVCEVTETEYGLSRDRLLALLEAENILARRYFFPGLHRTLGFKESLGLTGRRLPVTDHLCNSCIQLPIGALVTCDAVKMICDIIEMGHNNACRLNAFFEK